MADPATDAGFWLLLVVVAAATMAFRLSFVEAFSRRETIPPTVRRLLRYVPPAVIAALVAPAFLAPGGSLVAGPDPRLVAGLAAALVAWRTESTLATLAVGMGVLWAAELLGVA